MQHQACNSLFLFLEEGGYDAGGLLLTRNKTLEEGTTVDLPDSLRAEIPDPEPELPGRRVDVRLRWQLSLESVDGYFQVRHSRL